ncbi:hypothetical protein ACFX2J_022167 [Malus domestica]
MVLHSIALGLSFSVHPKSVITTLCFLQFWLGLGIGGDYSLSATIMSEYANKKTRGAFIAAVFAMQRFGILAGGIVTLIVATRLIRLSRLLHTLWTEPLLLHIKLTLSSATSDMSKVLQVQFEAEEEELEKITQEKSNSFGLFTKQFVARHGLHLLGTTSTWFLLDIAFYSQNLFQKDIFNAIRWIPKLQEHKP